MHRIIGVASNADGLGDARRVAALIVIGVAVLVMYLGFEVGIAGELGFPLDDAWIHAVFARNFCEGRGFSFNAHEPVAGSTAPLWTLLMAAIYALSHEMVWGTKVLGGILYLAGILLVYPILQLLTGDRRTAMLGATLVALLNWNAWGALSGMEIPLHVALSLGGLWLFLRGSTSAWLDRSSTVLFGLAALARPECLSLVMAAWIIGITDGLRRLPGSSDWRRLVPHVILLLVVIAPAVLFNYSTLGTLVPSTYSIKVGSKSLIAAIASGDGSSIWNAVLGGPVMHVPLVVLRLVFTNPFPLPFAIFGGARLWAGMGISALRSRVIPAAFILYPAAMSVVEPGAKLANRYITTWLVLYCLLGAVGIMAAWKALAGSNATARHFFCRWFASAHGGGISWPRARASMIAIAALAVVFQLGSAVVMARRFGIEVDNINSLHLAAGRWIRDHTPADAVIALDDIGGITYVSRRPMVDMIGLVTQEVMAMRRAGKSTAEFLEAARPDFVATVRPHVLAEAGTLYELIHVQTIRDNIASVNDTIAVFEATWHLKLADRHP